jgi:bifunctional non-homologous end joining protein LigD
MLATLPDTPPPLVDPALVYEPKYDGIRAIVEVIPAKPRAQVRIWSRLGNEKTAQFPDVIDAVAAWGRDLEGPVVLDGEVVALDERGRPAGFQRLQHRIHVSVPGYRSRKAILPPDQQPAALVAFDLLRRDDTDLRNKPLEQRRSALQALFEAHPSTSPLLRLSEQSRGDGRALMARADAEGWEGLLVKRATSPYRTARRSPEWLKLKRSLQDEFVIGGWTAPKGAREYFGALLLGVPQEPAEGEVSPKLGSKVGRAKADPLRYVGDVGTGFSGAELDRVFRLLKRLETPTSPFDPPPKLPHTVHWVRPLLVAQVRYTEITDDGKLRHPTYLGLRDDVLAKSVVTPKPANAAQQPSLSRRPASAKATAVRRSLGEGGSSEEFQGAMAGAKGAKGNTTANAEKVSSQDVASLIGQLNDLEKARKNGRLRLPDGDTLEVTNLHKVFWPEGKRTKGDLLRHYARVAPLILPVVANRPLVMKRLPNGVDHQAFYQHRAPEPVPPGVRIETLPDDDVPARLVGGSLKTLLYMAQLASISMDPFFSRIDALHTPDQVAIDLDPQPGATFSQILDVARWVRDELDRLHVAGFPKTSGSEGLHIYIPLPEGTTYQAGMLFCQIVATIVASKHPKVATVERTVSRRKNGTVYVDYLQNIEGKTLACAYSARGSAFAGVSTPLTWKEIDDSPAPQDFTIATIEARAKRAGDLWEKLRTHTGADLLGALEKVR